MIEKTVLDYLRENLDVPVLMEEPANADSYVLVEKTGSTGSGRHIKKATIAIQSYAPSLYEAAELNERVKEEMDNLIILNEVTKCELNSDYNYSDTTRKKYRYQAVFDLTHY